MNLIITTIFLVYALAVYSFPTSKTETNESTIISSEDINSSLSNSTNSSNLTGPIFSNSSLIEVEDIEIDTSDYDLSENNSTEISLADLTILIDNPIGKQELVESSEDILENPESNDMAVAESVVFRPLFAYRRLYQQRRRAR